MSVPSYLFRSLPLKFPNKRMDFPFPSLKLPNKGMGEYFKIIIFPPPKRFISFVLSRWVMSEFMNMDKNYQPYLTTSNSSLSTPL